MTDSSGHRGLYVDNVSLTVSGGGTGPYADWAIARGLNASNDGFDQDAATCGLLGDIAHVEVLRPAYPQRCATLRRCHFDVEQHVVVERATQGDPALFEDAMHVHQEAVVMAE